MSSYQEKTEELARKRADAWVAFERANHAADDAHRRIAIAHLDDFPDEPERIRLARAGAIAHDDPEVRRLVEAAYVALHEVERLKHVSPYDD